LHRDALAIVCDAAMFSVLFEVQPKPDQWDAYLGYAKMLRPELERIDGFVDNVRYRSLTRTGWILSLSGWRDEKALVRWRVTASHHEVQAKGRSDVLRDYHLRVGELTRDTRLPPGCLLHEQRLDETAAGEATTITLLDATLPPQAIAATAPEAWADSLGLDRTAPGLVAWDVFDAVLAPGDAIVLAAWRAASDARAFEDRIALPAGTRLRRVRVVRDYGMFDRREAPQYYPDIRAG
jgi:heme-degrading monooxygenase HmoA